MPLPSSRSSAHMAAPGLVHRGQRRAAAVPRRSGPAGAPCRRRSTARIRSPRGAPAARHRLLGDTPVAPGAAVHRSSGHVARHRARRHADRFRLHRLRRHTGRCRRRDPRLVTSLARARAEQPVPTDRRPRSARDNQGQHRCHATASAKPTCRHPGHRSPCPPRSPRRRPHRPPRRVDPPPTGQRAPGDPRRSPRVDPHRPSRWTSPPSPLDYHGPKPGQLRDPVPPCLLAALPHPSPGQPCRRHRRGSPNARHRTPKPSRCATCSRPSRANGCCSPTPHEA